MVASPIGLAEPSVGVLGAVAVRPAENRFTAINEPVELITIEQAAETLGVTVKHLRTLVKQGAIETHEVKTVRRLIVRADLDALIEHETGMAAD